MRRDGPDRVVSTFHPSSSVVASTRCSLTLKQRHLVLAKPDRVDVFSDQPSGLQFECSVPIWGRVVAVAAVHAEDTDTHDVAVLTDHPEPCLYILSPKVSPAGELTLVSHGEAISLHERIGRPAEFFTGMVVDPTGRIVVVSLYTGKLRVLDLSSAQPGEGFDVNIPELNVLSLCFVPSDDELPVLGILHRDYNQRIQLLSRELNMDQLELSIQPAVLLQPTLLSSGSFPEADTPPILVSVSATNDENTVGGEDPFLGGVLVIGGRKIVLHKVASAEWQERKKAKQKKERRKSSSTTAELAKAREKEEARRNMKRKAFCSAEWPFGEITAWTRIDEDRLLLGDAFGRLSMLVLRRSQSDMLMIVPLGQASPPTTLAYLDQGFAYVGSHYGDSQIVRIHATPRPGTTALELPAGIATTTRETTNSKGKGRAVQGEGEEEEADEDMEGIESNRGSVLKMTGSVIEIVQTFPGLSPIVDAVVADVDGSGQPQMVVCSGGQGAGAVKVVRKGAELQEHAVVDGLEHIVNIWSLKPRSDAKQHTHLLVSTLSSTYCLEFGASQLLQPVEADSHKFATTTPTIAVSNMVFFPSTGPAEPSSIIAQVTPSGIRILEYQDSMDQFTLLDDWTPDRERISKGRQVVAASISSGRIALALSGGIVILICLDLNKKCKLEDAGTSSNPFGGENAKEISAISITPINPEHNRWPYIVVSSWETNEVAVLEHDRKVIRTVAKTGPLPSFPRSLLLRNFGLDNKVQKEKKKSEADYLPYLLVGMADGTLASYVFDVQTIEGSKTKSYALKDEKITSLGTTPVSLTALEMDKKPAVCACGSRASFLFHSQGRLRQAPILVNGVTAVARIDVPQAPASVIVATSSRLSFGSFGPLDQTHIRSSPLGSETPVNIAWHPELKIFGVACNRIRPGQVGEFTESADSSLKLMDGTSLEVIDSVQCKGELTTLSAVTLDCDVDGEVQSVTRFCAGTVVYDGTAQSSSNGYLLLFNVHPKESASGKMLTVLSRMSVQGCIYAIRSVKGMLAVAKDTSVTLLHLEHFGATDYRLIKLHEWNHNYVITSLSPLPSGDGLAVGDAICSVSVLKVEESRLETAARDNTPLWPVCISAMDETTVVGVNSDCNFFSYQLNGTTKVLENNGHWYLGDFVNRIIPGAVSDTKSPVFESRQIFFTSTGRIGVLSTIENSEYALKLTGLQRNMEKIMFGTGKLDHLRYRAPANVRGRSDAQAEATGFLDGDFLEQYLSLPPYSKDTDAVLNGKSDAERIRTTDHEVRAILEGLQGLH